MIVVDASVWVSHLVARDAHHGISRRWLSAVLAAGETIAGPGLLLAEVGGAIARRSGAGELGRRAIDHIRFTPGVRLVNLDADLGLAAAHLAADRGIRGADAFYVALAMALDAPLVSWDREQLTRAEKVIAAYRPDR